MVFFVRLRICFVKDNEIVWCGDILVSDNLENYDCLLVQL